MQETVDLHKCLASVESTKSYTNELHRRLLEKSLWIQQARCLAQS